MLYKNILVPHAGTPSGDEALKHAIHIAKSNSLKIIILHVVEGMPHAPLIAGHSSQMASIKKQLREVTQSLMDQMRGEMSKKAKLCEKEGISSQVRIASGNTLDEIIKIVQNQKIDLIIMAKRRKLKGIKSLLKLGSVSRKVLENVSCPILMIDIEKK